MALKKFKIKPEDMEEYFDFLDDLRLSGRTNMFGATPYLEKEFGISRDTAVFVLSLWMETFTSRTKGTKE